MTFFTLLPNARTQLSAIASQPAAGALRRQLAFGVEIRADGSPVTGESRVDVGAEFLSAGDVIGVDAAHDRESRSSRKAQPVSSRTTCRLWNLSMPIFRGVIRSMPPQVRA